MTYFGHGKCDVPLTIEAWVSISEYPLLHARVRAHTHTHEGDGGQHYKEKKIVPHSTKQNYWGWKITIGRRLLFRDYGTRIPFYLDTCIPFYYQVVLVKWDYIWIYFTKWRIMMRFGPSDHSVSVCVRVCVCVCVCMFVWLCLFFSLSFLLSPPRILRSI